LEETRRVKLSFEQETPRRGGFSESEEYEITGIAATVVPDLAVRITGTPG
jgi:hypothetical protein